MAKDPYVILQVARHAEPEVVEAAYRRLARKYHPDVNSSMSAKVRMQDINWAYSILRDTARRAQYDRSANYGDRQGYSSSRRSQKPPPGSSTSSSSAGSARQTRTEYSRPPGQASSGATAQPKSAPVTKGRSRAWLWILGGLGLIYVFSALSNSNESSTSPTAPQAEPERPVSQRESSQDAPAISDDQAILILLNLMIEDPRYDSGSSSIHKYIQSIDVERSFSRLTYTAWIDGSVEEFIELGADLILFSAVVLDGSDMFEGSLTYVEVVNPGPQNSSATLFVSGRSEIESIASGTASVYDVMENIVDWGNAEIPTGGAGESQSCPFGCSEAIAGCNIKGNISIETNEKIYHVPGQEFYSATIIRPEYGERWFCTEQEAVANGWRKAKN